jgi:fibronectin type 3 domain-containing protein
LAWDASSSVVAGYNAFRGTQSGGPYAQLNSSVISSTSYSDPTVASGQTYFYVVTAVDSSGAESDYSNEVSATIP